MFVFIIECQLVLMKPSVFSKQWVISVVVRVMTRCFLPLRIYSQLVVIRWWGSGDVVVVLVTGKPLQLNTHICSFFYHRSKLGSIYCLLCQTSLLSFEVVYILHNSRINSAYICLRNKTNTICLPYFYSFSLPYFYSALTIWNLHL